MLSLTWLHFCKSAISQIRNKFQIHLYLELSIWHSICCWGISCPQPYPLSCCNNWFWNTLFAMAAICYQNWQQELHFIKILTVCHLKKRRDLGFVSDYEKRMCSRTSEKLSWILQLVGFFVTMYPLKCFHCETLCRYYIVSLQYSRIELKSTARVLQVAN